MTHYVIIDGTLQKRTSATERWASRAYKNVPKDTEEKPDPVALFQVDHENSEEDTE